MFSASPEESREEERMWGTREGERERIPRAKSERSTPRQQIRRNQKPVEKLRKRDQANGDVDRVCEDAPRVDVAKDVIHHHHSQVPDLPQGFPSLRRIRRERLKQETKMKQDSEEGEEDLKKEKETATRSPEKKT